jgi:uncharacterized protein (TIGR04551 family)
MTQTQFPAPALLIAVLCLIPVSSVHAQEEASTSSESTASESSEGDSENDSQTSDDASSSKEAGGSNTGDEVTTQSDADAESKASGDDETSRQKAIQQLQKAASKTSEESGGDDEESASKKGSESPISGLSGSSGDDDGFVAVEDIEEEALQEITPAEVYPYLEWEGMFQVHSDANVNFDLNTGGTSAILPPLGNNLPASGPPADPDNGLLWTTDMDFRLDPTLHITERLSVHTELSLLDNLAFGSLSKHRLTGAGGNALRPDPSRTVTSSNQIAPREREWFEDSIQVNEAYGQVDFFLGTLKAGRMDFDWGLGMFANDGDCADCKFGDHVDRIMFRTKPWKFHTMAAIDFPDQGETSQSAARPQGQPYDLARVDNAQQYTFAIFKEALSRKEKNLRQQRLKDQKRPVFEGGALFMFRKQDGAYIRGPEGSLAESRESGSNQPTRDQGGLIYRGLNLYMPDLWARTVYSPDANTFVRVELELNGAFGEMDNATSEPVGTGDEGDDAVNCFDEGVRDLNPECTPTDEDGADIFQLGAALESEFHFGWPVRFGLNGGFASGGNAPNWGYNSVGGGQLDFYRFDPNYHVDLILFREVLGTVTNAYYANPYIQARFYETPEHRVELQFDTIASRVADRDGAPSPESKWLGLELDAAARYIQVGSFQIGLEGGVLFPFGALDARQGAQKLTQPNPRSEGSEFVDSADADIAWTIQSNLVWQF